MNTAQKVILSLYVLTGTVVWYNLIKGSSCRDWSLLFCIFVNIILSLLTVFLILGIPTFILYKIWGDKKKTS